MATKKTTAASSRNGTFETTKAVLGSPKDVPTTTFVIPRPQKQTIAVSIRGTSPLLVHAWGDKARKMMLDKQMKRATGAKEAKNPEQDVLDSLYVADEGWYGFPSSAFKAAMVGACRQVDGLPMTLAKRMCFVLDDGFSTKQGMGLVRIYGDWQPHESMVRLESGVADIRFRAIFMEWTAVIRIEVNVGIISAEQMVNLLALAGDSEGVGEGRPSSPKSATGKNGRWEVEA